MSVATAKRVATIDAYLRTLAPAPRMALERLRRTLHALAPGAEECINYGVPTLKVGGRDLVHFAAAAKHCSLFPGARAIAENAAALAGRDVSKGTVRFTPDAPLPAALVRRLVKARLAELSEKREPRTAAKGRTKAKASSAPRARAKATAAKPRARRTTPR